MFAVIVGMILAGGVLFAILWLLRSFVLWYWRQNTIADALVRLVALQESRAADLRETNEHLVQIRAELRSLGARIDRAAGK